MHPWTVLAIAKIFTIFIQCLFPAKTSGHYSIIMKISDIMVLHLFQFKTIISKAAKDVGKSFTKFNHMKLTSQHLRMLRCLREGKNTVEREQINTVN